MRDDLGVSPVTIPEAALRAVFLEVDADGSGVVSVGARGGSLPRL